MLMDLECLMASIPFCAFDLDRDGSPKMCFTENVPLWELGDFGYLTPRPLSFEFL